MNNIFNENNQDIINMLYYKYNNDKNYQKSIQNKYDNNWHKLTWFELYILEELVHYGKNNYLTIISNKNNLTYDDYIKLNCRTKEETKDTLFNIFIGNDIYEFLKNSKDNKIKEIFERQKDGKIANIDKPYVIDIIRPNIIDAYSQYEKEVEKAFNIISLLNSNYKDILKMFILHNTNISINEIGVSMNNNYEYTLVKNMKRDDKNE